MNHGYRRLAVQGLTPGQAATVHAITFPNHPNQFPPSLSPPPSQSGGAMGQTASAPSGTTHPPGGQSQGASGKTGVCGHPTPFRPPSIQPGCKLVSFLGPACPPPTHPPSRPPWPTSHQPTDQPSDRPLRPHTPDFPQRGCAAAPRASRQVDGPRAGRFGLGGRGPTRIRPPSGSPQGGRWIAL